MTSRSVIVGQQEPKGGRVSIDLDTLLRTRLLIQANSGGGKSWLLRRLAEQLFGRIPVLIIDPEGEFATLREKYGYVLAAKGGDTPADVRSAEILATRLLELRASAVCDLYEMKPADRHEWVSRFLNALIDAPKKLWGPLIVIVDEAHIFCPEKGAGESVASEAMTDLATRGRKRGYTSIWATQRLAKLRKDAAAELQNVLIGPTFMDADRERAADALGVAKGDRKPFFDQIKLLPEGHFFGLGRAISLERVLIKIGSVETTHPEPGSTKHAAAPPPPPEKVKALLAKLADLPAEAEAEKRTAVELRQEITRLKRDLVDAKRANPAPAAKVETKRVEISVVKPADLKRAEKLVEKLSAITVKIGGASETMGEAVMQLSATIAIANERPAPAPLPPASGPVRVGPPYQHMRATMVPGRATPGGVVMQQPKPFVPSARAYAPSDVSLGEPERKILTALAETPEGLPKRKLGIRSGYSSRAGHFGNVLGGLRSKAYVQGTAELLQITPAGRAALGPVDPLPRGEELVQVWMSRLGTPEQRVLRAAIAAYPRALTKQELAEAAGFSAQAGHFGNTLGRLRSLDLIVGHGQLSASEDLFS